jgi:hypothetical protein
MRAIFISYRRDDTEGQAGRLFGDLAKVFGQDALFMDVAAIEPGRDFRRAIDEHVASCGVLLCIIGRNWLTAKDETGRRRLDDRVDFVRLETASALKRDIPVVPVLVHGATMPRADDLPDDLKDLAYRNGVELTHSRWDSDVQLLTKALQPYVQKAAPPTPPPAAQPPTRPPPGSPEPRKAGEGKSRKRIIGVGLVTVVIAVIGVGFAMRDHRSAPSDSAAVVPAAAEPAGGNADSASSLAAAAPPPAASEPAAGTTGTTPVVKPEQPGYQGASDTAASASDASAPSVAKGIEYFSGSWANIDQATRSIPRIQIRFANSVPYVHVWGKCHPTDCDWGEVKGEAFGGNVGSTVASDTQVITALYVESFARKTVTIRAEQSGRIKVETATVFTDNSGRQPYAATSVFRRE